MPLIRFVDKLTVMWWCPGCNEHHGVPVNAGKWTWDMAVDRPTLSPSVLVKGVFAMRPGEAERILAGEKIEPRPRICHCYVRAGRIEFLSDCNHAMAGTQVDMLDLDEI